MEEVGRLADYGLLGILLIISLGTIAFLYRDAKTERGERLKDMKDVWIQDVQYRSELKALIQNILDILRGGAK